MASCCFSCGSWAAPFCGHSRYRCPAGSRMVQRAGDQYIPVAALVGALVRHSHIAIGAAKGDLPRTAGLGVSPLSPEEMREAHQPLGQDHVAFGVDVPESPASTSASRRARSRVRSIPS